MSDSEYDDFESIPDSETSDWEVDPGSRSFKFTVVSLAQVVEAQKSLVAAVADTVGIPLDWAAKLLNDNKWQQDLAISRLFDDPEYLETLNLTNFSPSLIELKLNLCVLCYEEDQIGAHLGCGHPVCKTCFASYIKIKLNTQDIFDLRCPGDAQCPKECTAQVVRQLLNDYDFRYFEKINAEIFITFNRERFCACPTPDCRFYIQSAEPISPLLISADQAALNTATIETMATCNCSNIFCFLCGEDHLPVSCSIAKRWLKLSEDASFLWLQSFTKPCPKCTAPIQKVSGCDHITCPCGYHFCWACLSHFVDYGHRCPSVASSNQLQASSGTQAEIFSKRILDYSPRIMSQLANRKYHQNILSKSNPANATNDPLNEFFSELITEKGSVLDTHKILANSRGLVAWTYVLLLHVQDSNARYILEQCTQNLQDASEELGKLVLRNPKISNFKPDLLKKSVYVDQRVQVLLAHITDSEWTFLQENDMQY